MRSFCDITCSQFKTWELEHEVRAKQRAQQCAQKRVSVSRPSKGSALATSEKRMKEFNLFTPKFHALGDYVHTIWMFGTTDSFSTQVVWNTYSQSTYILANA